jgi:hypothetical protein
MTRHGELHTKMLEILVCRGDFARLFLFVPAPVAWAVYFITAYTAWIPLFC